MTTSNAGLYGPEAILSQTGVPATTTPVTVYLHGTTTAATLYSNQTESGTVSNPVNTDSYGNLSFWATPGLYTLSFTVGGVATTKLVLVNPWWADSVINVGVIQMIAASTADTGYLLCRGTAVSRTTYAKLFARIGTTYGAGNGTTTFNLPDFGGKVPAGWKTGDSSFGALGGAPGSKSITLTAANVPKFNTSASGAAKITVPAHKHQPKAGDSFIYGSTPSSTIYTQSGSSSDHSPAWNLGATATTTTASVAVSFGSTSPTGIDVIQPSLTVNFQIKV